MNPEIQNRGVTRVLDQDTDLAFEFSAGTPGFIVTDFKAEEAIFEGFNIEIELFSCNSDINLHDLLDTPSSLELYHKYDAPRYFHGVVVEMEKRGSAFDKTYYSVVLQPALYRLRYTSDCRIFQQQSVPDIVDKILTEFDVRDVNWRLASPHNQREYCVMYGETYYDFLRRLLAEEGMFFWFEHGPDNHTMIISDAPMAMPILNAAPELHFKGTPSGSVKDFWVDQFNQVERLRATNRVVRDYSFKEPAYHQQHHASQVMNNGAKGRYELYDYPGRHKNGQTGKNFNDFALTAHRVDATTADGRTNCIQLSAGYIFKLSDHPDQAANTDHRLLKVRHEGRQSSALGPEASENKPTTYRAEFSCQPARIPYRPLNPTPKPIMDGPQIAHVTGPEDEEIYCDDHGRVKVWFPWDRYNEKNDNSSCWIRVSQNSSGGAYGSVAIPRVGQEVLVDFLSGDPDQPIIVGRTYNETSRTPYELPANKTKMVFRSQTTGGDGFNEISFEDKPGREQMFIQSQREKVELIGNRSMTIQTTSLGAAGVAETAAMGAATTAMSFLFMGLVPFAMPSTISANTEVTQAATELLNKRR